MSTDALRREKLAYLRSFRNWQLVRWQLVRTLLKGRAALSNLVRGV